MMPNEILNHARFLTKVSTTDGTGDDITLLRILNDYYMRQFTKIVNLNQNKFGVKSDTTLNIVASQEGYHLPADCFRVKRIEITYDGTNWKKVKIQDSSAVQDLALDSTDINNNYQTGSPRADIYGDVIYLRPIPTTSVSLGLRLWYIQTPTLLTTSVLSSISAVLTPKEFHGYLSNGVASEIADRQGNDKLATRQMTKWENGLLKMEAEYPPQVLDESVDFIPNTENYG